MPVNLSVTSDILLGMFLGMQRSLGIIRMAPGPWYPSFVPGALESPGQNLSPGPLLWALRAAEMLSGSHGRSRREPFAPRALVLKRILFGAKVTEPATA